MANFSVLLSVFYKEKPEQLKKSLESIFNEQILKPKQIVLVKDGPLDDSLELVIEDFSLSTICEFTIVELKENIGLASALNQGLKYCRYEIVARMDTDDISLPERFKLQIDFLNANPDISVLSGQIVEYCSGMKNILGRRVVPTKHDDIFLMSKYRNPISHPATAFRKNDVIQAGGYPNLMNSQDWALWSLMLTKGYKMANLRCDLLWMRTDSDLFKRRGFKYYKNELKLFKYQKLIGHVNNKQYLTNILSKAVLRLSPIFVKSFLYRNFR
ncbi:Glycosyl transferase [Pseudoalteromonas carrageenovora]|uniref:UDP-Gal:alpha-D-GlcNAc-diphosphoundecaprenol beta-1,3-galactosyltransferase, family GT2 n=1 Tax=Pseudoalteromonas carrageenovora IAM 12662 TaxID=1314868 RepID=A0A2K4X5Z5_PSEVC|nr:glycosyltransferase [Pseudoalteromonas carrageenovora]MBE0381953.1 hypothetical protein [Pseudoalteromonas carrageenovora IAM 12662]QBJ70697.1 Glycosyl transferase [Pseudoalteromonas carrageenovora]GEB69747.1 glycosyl transferase [Pseudoalteromonas carrageenovora]SOU39760.1 UDP-Gal:alpha-D-GlcNAc-diphosphoundecaprenol beta-1,3-galactosyltransferase, family GT2 [Pseudoalteromonas carrageenovora IAM 12662]